MNYQKIKTIGNAITDSLLPKTCPVCREIVMPRGNQICRECLKSFSFVKDPTCEKCGKEILTGSQCLCYDCRHNRKSFTKGAALLNYDDVARECMSGIKFLNRKEDIDVFAAMMANRLGKIIVSWDPECLIPVPVHKERLIKRGYNQAEELAKCLGKRLNIPVRTDILVRNRRTAAQKDLDPAERLENLTGAFETRKRLETTRCVVLVDDIYTTGSTVEACTRALMAAGAADVRAACICIGSEV